MTDEMEGQPAASRIVEGSAFDIEEPLQVQEIERHLRPLPLRRDGLLPLFSSKTAAFLIPIGIWDKTLGYLEDEPETLSATERLDSIGSVHLYARYIKTIPRPRRSTGSIQLLGSAAEEGKQRSRAENRRSLAPLGAFAAMLAGGLLPRLSSVCIRHGEWIPGSIPQSMFLHLSSFHSITRIDLWDITLPSITVLLRLVCALDRLEELAILDLRLLDRRVPPANRRWAPSPTLKTLFFNNLNWPDELRAPTREAELQTSSSSETVLFLCNAVSCSDLDQLLHFAGKALRQLKLSPFKTFSGVDPHSVQPLRARDVDLSRNVGLRDLDIHIDRDTPAGLLERAETYSVIQQIISSTCNTGIEQINIEVELDSPAAGPSIMSHVLLALRRAVYPPDQPLAPEKYKSMNCVELRFYDADETSKRQMDADWDRLVPIWLPSFYSRGIMKRSVPPPPGAPVRLQSAAWDEARDALPLSGSRTPLLRRVDTNCAARLYAAARAERELGAEDLPQLGTLVVEYLQRALAPPPRATCVN
ncbi:hypothetical protein WOLCODRAFT_165827 [Wolfiporia cocos MD-104 SS10]|uniref:Uncharacterized protein n=1 Tax=Wolfiporia cocos (strain MD-104) TaxID=742152 RepID=A0A2H3IYI3_WOLCO|nr:hypothetical protein WOLCODRAFT_165827 [Wolfiporia cocos MD-104 SS10]